METSSVAVAVFADHVAAENAVKTLANAGVDLKAISIIGKNYHSEETPVGYFNAGDRAKAFGKLGAFWGGMFGLLFGSLFIFIPVFGHLVILGPIAAIIANAIEGVVVGGASGAIAGALSAIGVPKNSVVQYEAALKADQFVVAVHGDEALVATATKSLAPHAEGEVSTFKADA